MGCAFDAGIKHSDQYNQEHYDQSQANRRARLPTIDTRRNSNRVVDKIIENIVVSKNALTPAQEIFAMNFLQKNSLFTGLSHQQLKALAAGFIPATAAAGQYIFRQGDIGNCFFLIEKGVVTIQIDNQIVKTLSSGQTFGEVALLLRTKRSASVRVKGKSSVDPYSKTQQQSSGFGHTLNPTPSYNRKRSSSNASNNNGMSNSAGNSFLMLPPKSPSNKVANLSSQNSVSQDSNNSSKFEDCKLLVMKPLLFRQTMQKLKSDQYQSKRQSIEKIQIFTGLTNKQKLSLANALKSITFEKGQKIFRQGQVAHAFYIINSGKVVIEMVTNDENGQKVVNMTLGKNQTFGQSVFISKGRRKASAIAQERTVVSLIAKDAFQKNLGTTADNVYFYNLKKWALKRSPIFSQYSQYSLNSINLAFITEFAKDNQQLRHNCIIICLQNSIKNCPKEQKVYGEQEWKDKNLPCAQKLYKEKDGLYAYLPYEKLNKLLENLELKKQTIRRKGSRIQQKENIQNSEISSNGKKYSLDLSNFEYLTDLGQGQFGTVKLVRDPTLKRLYALKQISKASIKKQGLQHYIQEQRHILQKIQFPYIVGFVKSFSDNNYVYFLMEYIKGVEMFNVIRQLPSLNKQISRYFFAALLLSLQHLHSHNIIYRDIKPQNSVVDHKGKPYLIDMGTAKHLTKQKSYRTFTIIGTPHYMAPEVFSGQGYSFQSDIWSLGVLLFEFVGNRLPFAERQVDPYRIMQIIKRQPLKIPSFVDKEQASLLNMILNKNSRERQSKATFEKIKQHQYFEGFSWHDMINEKIFAPYIPKQFKKQPSNHNKTLHMEGKPLLKQLYPKQYSQNGDNFNLKQDKNMKQWHQTMKF